MLVLDTDVAVFQNPFPFLSDIHDIQVSSDGLLIETAFGYPDYVGFVGKALGKQPVNWDLGEARYKQKIPGDAEYHVNGVNVGCLYIRSTRASMEFMNSTLRLLLVRREWEQLLVSTEIFNAALQGQIFMRVLDPFLFTNSGFYYNNWFQNSPVLLHASHHGNKREIMVEALAANYTGVPKPEHPPLSYKFNYSGIYCGVNCFAD